MPEFYPTLAQVSIPRNPSPFAVFAAVRATCLENRRRQTALLQLQSTSRDQYLKLFVVAGGTSVTRLGDLLHFVQLFKACGNNYFAQIAHKYW